MNCCFRSSNMSISLAQIEISSTYSVSSSNHPFFFIVNMQLSKTLCSNPIFNITLTKCRYHFLGACFSPYKLFSSCKHFHFCIFMSIGGFTQTSSSSGAHKNALSTSSGCMRRLCICASANITRNVICFPTGANVSS